MTVLRGSSRGARLEPALRTGSPLAIRDQRLHDARFRAQGPSQIGIPAVASRIIRSSRALGLDGGGGEDERQLSFTGDREEASELGRARVARAAPSALRAPAEPGSRASASPVRSASEGPVSLERTAFRPSAREAQSRAQIEHGPLPDANHLKSSAPRDPQDESRVRTPSAKQREPRPSLHASESSSRVARLEPSASRNSASRNSAAGNSASRNSVAGNPGSRSELGVRTQPKTETEARSPSLPRIQPERAERAPEANSTKARSRDTQGSRAPSDAASGARLNPATWPTALSRLEAWMRTPGDPVEVEPRISEAASAASRVDPERSTAAPRAPRLEIGELVIEVLPPAPRAPAPRVERQRTFPRPQFWNEVPGTLSFGWRQRG